MAILRKIESSILKKQIIVFASLRNTLLCNEYLYLISKAVILSESESEIVSEERFAEPSSSINVSILSKPGSGKLEVDDRFEFDFYEGFKIRTVKSKALNLGETPGRPSSTFNMERKNPNEHVKFTDAKIFVEDSDRDSDNEMEADADF